MSVGTIVFPVTFILTDVVNEYYGRKGARTMTLTGMMMLVLGFFILWGARVLPSTVDSPLPQSAMDAVFGMSMRLFAASLFAFLISQFVDIHSFQTVKTRTASKHLWLRAVLSTAFSQVVDTVVVNFGMLLGRMSLATIFNIILISYVYKVVVATLLTPLCYLAHNVITERYGLQPMPHES